MLSWRRARLSTLKGWTYVKRWSKHHLSSHDEPTGCGCDRVGAEWARGRDRDCAGGQEGAGARGRADDRRRRALGRADAAGVRPRRLFGNPFARDRVAVLPHAAARRARAALDRAAADARAPAGRWDGGDDREVGRRDGGADGSGRRGVSAAVRRDRGRVAKTGNRDPRTG